MSKKTPKRPQTDKNPIKDQIDNGERVSLEVIEGGRQDAPEDPALILDDDEREPEGLSPKELELVRICAGLDQNDRDNARRLVEWYGDDLVYVIGLGWLTWRGSHWQRDEGELQARLKAQSLVDKIKLEVPFIFPTKAQEFLLAAADDVAKKATDDLTPEDNKLLAKAAKALDQIGKKKTARRTFAVSSGNSQKTGAMLTQAQSLQAIDQDLLDADRMAINVKNGTLKIAKVRDGTDKEGKVIFSASVKFEDHARGDMNTKMADVIYDPKATCPQFMDFLHQMQPETEMQLLMQVFHGYMILAGNDEQKIIFHYGSGANGKTIFIETIGRLLGDYRSVVSPDTITGDGTRGGQQASPDLARLFNARVATIEELPRGAPLKESLIKSLSGGTRILARFLLKENFEFEPLFTAVMTGNDLPEISGTDNGIWRRLLLVKWPITIPDAEQVPFGVLLARFDEERTGILNWLLDGICLYLEGGLAKYVPPSVSKFTDEYRADKDPVGQFVDACVNRDPDNKVQAKDMFKAYQDWSEHNGMKPWQQKAFGTQMNKLEFKKQRGRVYFYLDCALHDVPEPTSTGSNYYRK